jgi:hypothetical protein
MSNKGLIIRIMLIMALFLGMATVSMGQGLVADLRKAVLK